MNSTEPSVEKQKLRELKPFSGISSSPSLVIIKKTLIFDLLTKSKLLISIIFMVLIPALILAFIPSNVLSGDEYLVQLLGFTTWYYNFSILVPIIIISATGPLISEELRSGTMLFLVSKPINRTKIVLSKFIALYLFGVVISILGLSIISLIAVIKYAFVDIGAYLGIFILYSLIITLFFGGLTIGFSSVFRRPRNVLLIPLTLVIFSFLVMMMFKPLLFLGDNWYEKYLLYNFDLGYHFANIFLWIAEAFNPDVLNFFGQIFWMFGITTMEWDGMDYIYEKTNYYPPFASLLFLIVIAVIFLVVAALYLKKRDIS
jgi:ABC-type transport system involved in multi-copper enzyme maturation permease subunit